MSDDRQLLRRFAADRSETAFGELVARHVTLVYSAALRQTGGDAHRAQDIAQIVFTDFARKAPSLSEKIILAGWLHRATIFAARQILRGERRRRAREQEAVTMNAIQSEIENDNWQQIRPLLDEALERLNKTDRDALLLRFFEQQSLAQVGATLGGSEDAARKRVQRALEKLRAILTRNGVTTTAAALSTVISANAIQVAPAGLAAMLTTNSIAVAGTATTFTLLKIMTMTKLKLGISALIIAGATTAFVIQHQTQIKLREENETSQRQQSLLTEQIQQLQQERDDATNRLAGLLAENTQLKSNSNENELLKLRGEVTRLHNESLQLKQEKVSETNDPTALTAQAWIERVKLLKQQFEQWPKKTPELQLLNEQDWLNETANHELTNNDVTRQAMADLRKTAKGKFADAVNQALDDFSKSNNGQLPSDLSQLKSYLQPPADSILDGYEITKPGWVHLPQPNSPNSKNAETWALVMKGSFTPDGIAIRDGSYLSDPDYDMTIVIYNGGSYGYGPDKFLK